MLLRPALLLLVLAAAPSSPATGAEIVDLTEAEVAAIQAHRRAGTFDEALALLDVHPAVTGDRPSALALRGLVLLDAQRNGAARVIMARKFRSNRVLDDSLTNTFIGRMRLGLGETKRARTRLDAAVQFDEANDEARFLSEACRAQEAAEPAAVLALQKFGAKDALPTGLFTTTIASVSRNVGLTRAQGGANDDATLQLLQIVLDHGEDEDVQLVCARVLFRRSEAEAGEELLSDIAKRRPHRMQDVLFERALAQHERGETETALETVRGAIVLSRDHVAALQLASQLALDLGELEDASRFLSLLDARVNSIDVDRLQSRYCLQRAELIPADDKEQRGNRVVLLREAEKRCITALKKDSFDVVSLERLLKVSKLLGDRSKVVPEQIANQIERAKIVQRQRQAERDR